ncbi:UNVERIFIED_CONTAM: hypothetical protein PYX00_011591 [Menopon gallinae]|uniref:non-specific serine/threonine protein kinase n=1 Tax=Menopon gallinae TaxID=328185 RepID=A0AAW2H7V8_9NEOP
MSLQNFEKMTAVDCDHNIIENRHNMCASAEMRHCEGPEREKGLQTTDVRMMCHGTPDGILATRKKEKGAVRSARKGQPTQQKTGGRRGAGAKREVPVGERTAAECGTPRLQDMPSTEGCLRADTWNQGEEAALGAETLPRSRPKRLSIRIKSTATRLSVGSRGSLVGRDSTPHVECSRGCGAEGAPDGARESMVAMSTSSIASMGGLSSLNFLDAENLNENLSVSMHEIQTQDVAFMSPPPARKRLFSIRKSSICNIMPPRPPARKKKTASPPPEEAQGNIEIVDILMEICIRKVSFDELKLKDVVKCGEATFSEVFRADDLIYKVVPIGDGCTDMDAFCRESYIFSKLSGEEGVCALRSVFVTTGKYPRKLLDAWDRYRHEFGSESERPTKYTKSQRFGVIVMENSGQDLEKYVFRDKADVKTFLRQFIECVARLERKYEFEHRDLHWGNVMIDDTDGLRMRIIDFSLSRMRDKSLVYMDLSKKPWLFEGDEGEDEQFGVYKEMRALCGNDWSRFTPMTNVLWIRYIVNKVEKKAARFSLKTFMKSLKLGIGSAANAAGLHNSTAGLW